MARDLRCTLHMAYLFLRFDHPHLPDEGSCIYESDFGKALKESCVLAIWHADPLGEPRLYANTSVAEPHIS